MKRAYYKWLSKALNREMELLVFGDRGKRIIFFPTRRARFYDYENWGVMGAIRHKIDAGEYQVICVDSVDGESFYNFNIPPRERILRHLQYEKYILEEVLPFTLEHNNNKILEIAGCSLGAYHALNFSLRHPQLVSKVIGMSGRYDLTQAMKTFRDLFQGYIDENVYLNTPNKFMTNLTDETYLNAMRKMDIVIAIGREDAFLQDNIYLSNTLHKKHINHQFYIWNGEAHNPHDWKRMTQLYF